MKKITYKNACLLLILICLLIMLEGVIFARVFDAETRASFTPVVEETEEIDDPVMIEKIVEHEHTTVVDMYTNCGILTKDITYPAHHSMPWSAWLWTASWPSKGVVTITCDEDLNVIVSTSRNYADCISNCYGTTVFDVEKGVKYFVYFLSQEEVTTDICISFEADPLIAEYECDPNSAWITFNQWLAAKEAGYTSDDLRQISTMTFWEVGKVSGEVQVLFPESSTEYTGMDSEILKELVAQVLINRTNSPYFGGTIYDNLVRPWQYHPDYVKVEEGYYNTQRAYENWLEAWNLTVDACIKVLSGTTGYSFPTNMIFQSNYPPCDMEPEAELHLGAHAYAVVQVGNQGSTCYFSYK